MEQVELIVRERTRALRDLMRAHRLKAADVGRILNKSPTTVRIWASRYDARSIPENELRLLRFELGQGGEA